MADWQETNPDVIETSDASTRQKPQGSPWARLSGHWWRGGRSVPDQRIERPVGRLDRTTRTLLAPLSTLLAGLRWLLHQLGKIAKPLLPQGLYARSLLIIITPVVILQSVIAFVFMERHWELVTERLSQAVTRDIAAVIEMVEAFPDDEADQTEVIRIARDALDLNVAFLPDTALPAALPKPFFDLLDRTLSQEISQRIERPFWIDTVGRSNLVEVRVKLNDGQVLRVFARRNQAYASNSHIFLVWMTGASLVLLIVAVLFLRNQIRPVLRLADAADRFGRGQEVDEGMNLRGAREIRRATIAFWRMRERIERHVDQRTAMLSGVSHDLRTILTRFKLELALLGDEKAAQEMGRDVDEMQAMLEGYLAFARGDDGEVSVPSDIEALLDDVAHTAKATDREVKVSFNGPATASVKPLAFKRLVINLVNNALRHANTVTVHAEREAENLIVSVEDDGPGIPEDKREEVFRPFYRMDEARNLDESGTGLGLAIARDIARAHGGDITLDDSSLGGLKATIIIPA
ncbi:MAG: ATP-binding protein [Hyphomicrobiales bacterium]|jgi:two-component system osmolarity sensor histidine kinase EnvZ